MEIPASERRRKKRTKCCGRDSKIRASHTRRAPFCCGPSNKKLSWNFGPRTRKIKLSCSCTNIGFAPRRELWGPSAVSETNKCRRAFTNWIGSIHRAISSLACTSVIRTLPTASSAHIRIRVATFFFMAIAPRSAAFPSRMKGSKRFIGLPSWSTTRITSTCQFRFSLCDSRTTA